MSAAHLSVVDIEVDHYQTHRLRPRVERLLGERVGDGPAVKGAASWALAFASASALFTEVIGIHALIGAFLAGVRLPSHAGTRGLIELIVLNPGYDLGILSPRVFAMM